MQFENKHELPLRVYQEVCKRLRTNDTVDLNVSVSDGRCICCVVYRNGNGDVVARGLDTVFLPDKDELENEVRKRYLSRNV